VEKIRLFGIPRNFFFKYIAPRVPIHLYICCVHETQPVHRFVFMLIAKQSMKKNNTLLYETWKNNNIKSDILDDIAIQ
jgi:hypothetical protein